MYYLKMLRARTYTYKYITSYFIITFKENVHRYLKMV